MAFDVASALVDDELQSEGSRYYLGEDAYLLVRSTEYKPFRLAHTKGTAPSGNKINSEKHVMKVSRFLAEELPVLVAKYLICGWHGLELNGKPLAYTPELCLKMAPKWEFIRDIFDFADNRANYVREQKEEVGNELKAVSSS